MNAYTNACTGHADAFTDKKYRLLALSSFPAIINAPYVLHYASTTSLLESEQMSSKSGTGDTGQSELSEEANFFLSHDTLTSVILTRATRLPAPQKACSRLHRKRRLKYRERTFVRTETGDNSVFCRTRNK